MKVSRPMEQWRIIVKDRYPAFIDWPTYEKICAIIKDNRAEYMINKTRGTPRDGDLLLHGIAWCGRCGHKMYVRYKNGGAYVCNHLRTHQALPTCQQVRAERIDEAVRQAFLAALAPAEIEALSSARRTKQQADRALLSGAERQLERKRYEAALAERQYRRVDPDNRLVAGELERRWEAALFAVRAVEETLERQRLAQANSQPQIGKPINSKVVALAGRLPEIWDGASDKQRKSLLRCLVEKVVLDRGEHDVATVRIVWCGGACSALEVKMRVNGVAYLTNASQMRERVLELARAGVPDDDIAAVLTEEGHRSPTCAEKVLPITVQRLRLGAGLKIAKQRTRWRHAPQLLSANELAAKLDIPVNWIYVQIRKQRIQIDRQTSGAYVFEDTPEVIDAVRNLRSHAVQNIDARINRLHQEGHQHG